MERNAARPQAGRYAARAIDLDLTLELGPASSDAPHHPHLEAIGVEVPDGFIEDEPARPEHKASLVPGNKAGRAERVLAEPAPRRIEAEPTDRRRLQTERSEKARVNLHLVRVPPRQGSTSRDREEQIDGIGIASGTGQLLPVKLLAVQEDLVRRSNPAVAIEQHRFER